MNLGALELFTIIVITILIIKLSVLFINPKKWMKVIDFVYAKSFLTTSISLILAAIILYYLFICGITIIQIFAVMLFFMMIMLAGFSIYSTVVLDMAHKIYNKNHILKKAWLYVLIWVLLMIWAIKELLLI